MRKVWLKPNARALTMGLLPPLVGELIGIGLLAIEHTIHPSGWLFACGMALVVIGLLLLVSLLVQLAQPRVACEKGELLLYVRTGGPVRVPLEVVEGFLLGQGPAMLSGAGHDWETSTLVIKLADNAEPWRQLDVKPAIASWCNSYVTIRGTWCEPLSVDVVNRLNARLAEAKVAVGVQSAR